MGESNFSRATVEMWRLALSVTVLAVLARAVQVEEQQGFVDEEYDAVVIEGNGHNSRRGRQLQVQLPFAEVVSSPLPRLSLSPVLATPREIPCLRKDTGLGKCMSLKTCYPYFKIQDFKPEDTWVMGLYDTCSYQSTRGRQVFGVCCNNTLPEVLPEEPKNEETKVDEDNDALVDEFPVESQNVRSTCGFRSVRPPQVTLYNQSPNLAPFFYAAQVQPYIVNGETAIPHEFPFMAALMNLNRQFCGGSLIDDNHILTAAHCVAHMSKYDVQNLRVRLGDHNIKDGTSDGTTVEKRVKRVIRHKGFSSSTLWNDVAILTLEDDVRYGPNIQPICLANGNRKYVDNIVTVAGWGTLREGGSQPSNLMKVDVKVWTNERCKSSYGSSAPGGITSHMLCASDYQKDSCSGDSGGPLFDCPYGGSCEQIGIVSWGIGCAKQQYPGVYTRVTEMMPWIKRIIAEY